MKVYILTEEARYDIVHSTIIKGVYSDSNKANKEAVRLYNELHKRDTHISYEVTLFKLK